jgi:hypothetical protein
MVPKGSFGYQFNVLFFNILNNEISIGKSFIIIQYIIPISFIYYIKIGSI